MNVCIQEMNECMDRLNFAAKKSRYSKDLVTFLKGTDYKPAFYLEGFKMQQQSAKNDFYNPFYL